MKRTQRTLRGKSQDSTADTTASGFDIERERARESARARERGGGGGERESARVREREIEVPEGLGYRVQGIGFRPPKSSTSLSFDIQITVP